MFLGDEWPIIAKFYILFFSFFFPGPRWASEMYPLDIWTIPSAMSGYQNLDL